MAACGSFYLFLVLSRGRLLPAFDSLVFLCTVPHGSLRLLASPTRPLSAAFAFHSLSHTALASFAAFHFRQSRFAVFWHTAACGGFCHTRSLLLAFTSSAILRSRHSPLSSLSHTVTFGSIHLFADFWHTAARGSLRRTPALLVAHAFAVLSHTAAFGVFWHTAVCAGAPRGRARHESCGGG